MPGGQIFDQSEQFSDSTSPGFITLFSISLLFFSSRSPLPGSLVSHCGPQLCTMYIGIYALLRGSQPWLTVQQEPTSSICSSPFQFGHSFPACSGALCCHRTGCCFPTLVGWSTPLTVKSTKLTLSLFVVIKRELLFIVPRSHRVDPDDYRARSDMGLTQQCSTCF